MRYSLKWLLAAMSYVALAAVALAQPTWYYADALKAAAFFATLAAVVGAIFNRGARQRAAVGFLAGSALLTVCLFLFPGCLRVPSSAPLTPYTSRGGMHRLVEVADEVEQPAVCHGRRLRRGVARDRVTAPRAKFGGIGVGN
jgi:hypothetical protein